MAWVPASAGMTGGAGMTVCRGMAGMTLGASGSRKARRSPHAFVIPADAGTQGKIKHAATAEADRGGRGARGKRLFLWHWVPASAGMTGGGMTRE